MPRASELLAAPTHVVREKLLSACPITYRPAFGDAIDAAHIHSHRLAVPLLLLELQRVRSTEFMCRRLAGAVGAISKSAETAAETLLRHASSPSSPESCRMPDDQLRELKGVMTEAGRIPAEIVKMAFRQQGIIVSVGSTLDKVTRRDRILSGLGAIVIILLIANLLK